MMTAFSILIEKNFTSGHIIALKKAYTKYQKNIFRWVPVIGIKFSGNEQEFQTKRFLLMFCPTKSNEKNKFIKCEKID
jgi:hypothetical protein